MGCRKECYKVQIIIMKLTFFFQHTETFDQHFFTILGEGPPPTPGSASAMMGVLCSSVQRDEGARGYKYICGL